MTNEERAIFYEQREKYRWKCEEFQIELERFFENYKPKQNSNDMTNQFYGQLDLTKIAALIQQQPELVRRANFKDGEHMLLPINVNDMQRTDEHGNTHSITAYCRKDDRNPNLNYFIANLKPSNNESQQPLDTSQANQFWGGNQP